MLVFSVTIVDPVEQLPNPFSQIDIVYKTILNELQKEESTKDISRSTLKHWQKLEIMYNRLKVPSYLTKSGDLEMTC